ncbi:protoporphyrinogen oxidase [Domibacillus iocasae]|uniref:Coproporphyrinogen III oxidase n=1 Tax=Domibacillus iocasae TaxID=1714016 RepID=A0A1E7DU74_9BACI|nr:protoporphyrinogen oxidase [Domibacillus iocasae]OES46621.1 protoporphyrinogen oxidase [Domibacillus iocasae]
MKTVVIIGGGITGMTAMYHLTNQHPDWNIVLVERNEQLGGKIRTITQDGFTIEAGADSIVARNAGVLPLVEELGLMDKLVYNETGVSYLYTNNMLHKIPEETVFGIPTSVESLNESTIISDQAKQEALNDFEKTDNPFGPDDSVGDFLTYYLGREIVEKQIAPVLSGVYSGRLDQLTMKSTLPYLLDYKNEYGSIIKGFSANKETFLGDKARKKFISFNGGLAVLIDRLEEKSPGARILKDTAVTNVSGQGVTLSSGETIEADDIVLAVPHDAAQKIMADPVLDEQFSELKNSSLISVYLGFDIPDERLPADGTGFIVTDGTDLTCDACTWTSRKWTHTSADRRLLVRLFYKSSNPHYETVAGLNEAELTKAALLDLGKSLGIAKRPITIEVTRWTNLMPNYHLGHGQAVAGLAGKMKERSPNVHLAGCSYFGVGIGACIQNGRSIAHTISGNGDTFQKG